MKNFAKKISTFNALSSYAKQTHCLLSVAILVAIATSNIYGKDKPPVNQHNPSVNITAGMEWINLKGYADMQSNLLQWEVSDATDIESFTIECSRNNDMDFQSEVSLKPVECSDTNKNNCFVFESTSTDKDVVVYYKVLVTYKDSHTLESNFIGISRTEKVASLNISNIQNESGTVTLTFKSPKVQNITLSILNRSGQLLAQKNIVADEGVNTYIYDASFINSTEMLIFSLNNQEEQITKKYMLASAW